MYSLHHRKTSVIGNHQFKISRGSSQVTNPNEQESKLWLYQSGPCEFILGNVLDVPIAVVHCTISDILYLFTCETRVVVFTERLRWGAVLRCIWGDLSIDRLWNIRCYWIIDGLQEKVARLRNNRAGRCCRPTRDAVPDRVAPNLRRSILRRRSLLAAVSGHVSAIC